jgi:hypothetical protein
MTEHRCSQPNNPIGSSSVTTDRPLSGVKRRDTLTQNAKVVAQADRIIEEIMTRERQQSAGG